MGESKRTTKLTIDLGRKEKGGANPGKQDLLERTAEILNEARAFYITFFLAHGSKLEEKVSYFSPQYGEYRERTLHPDELLTWAEYATVKTKGHPEIEAAWDFNAQFKKMPTVYRRSVIKDAIGKARGYLSNLRNFERSGKKKGKPGIPSARNHPTLYKGTLTLQLNELDYRDAFLGLKVYDGEKWVWKNYPVEMSRWHRMRLQEKDWEVESPKLVLKPKCAEIHIPQVKKVVAKKIKESKLDKDLITIGVDLNVRNLAVITARQHGKIIKTEFFRDKGLDHHRYRHTKNVSKRQWQSGQPVGGERSNMALWKHIRRTNEDFAHKAARAISDVCSLYPGSVLIFENLRKMRSGGESKSRRLNRKLANQIRGLVRDYAKYKAFVHATVTVEVNPHGTSRYCSRCGAKGERFSYRGSVRTKEKGGKLFHCCQCGYEANADFNASVNQHHSFYGEYHWQPRTRKKAGS